MRTPVNASCTGRGIVGLCCSLAGALLATTAGASPRGVNEVRGTMRGNLAALVALQPLVRSAEAFASPTNAKTVRASLAVLARTRHRFPRPQAQEPAAALSSLFAEGISYAQTDFEAGRPEAARLRLRATTGLCLGCHARQLSVADFAAAGESTSGDDLPPLERAAFLAATRQFDAALGVWRDVLSKPAPAGVSAHALSAAFASALAVAVRAKDDPASAVAVLEARCASVPVTTADGRTCVKQLNDAKAWAAEAFSASGASGEQLFTRASELVDFSAVADSLYPREEERVKLLRATAYLSLALEREPRAKWRGEALYRLGLCTGAALDPDLWPLDGLYLEACIRENPHSALAKTCVERLTERTVLDFTGSSGTQLPADVVLRLDALRALAR